MEKVIVSSSRVKTRGTALAVHMVQYIYRYLSLFQSVVWVLVTQDVVPGIPSPPPVVRLISNRVPQKAHVNGTLWCLKLSLST